MNKRFTLTENQAIQYRDTGNACLDFFSNIGAMRDIPEDAILNGFISAYEENYEVALMILFWARAARIGSGERNTFHIILSKLFQLEPNFVVDNAKTIAELGYWKDLIPYFSNPEVVDVFADAINAKDRLACKWAPRRGLDAKKLRDALSLTNKEYRKWLKHNSYTVEQQMSNKKWKNIEYAPVPGKAMRIYKNAFEFHDEKRFNKWLTDKDAKASVSASYPHEVLKLLFEDEPNIELAQKQWDSLKSFISKDTRILPMVDVSGSMNGLPMLVAVALGLYISEKNLSVFKNSFLTFSANPTLVNVEGSLFERMKKAMYAEWGMNTDFTKAYKLILENAKIHDLKSNQMPNMLLVLSDMQFDDSQSHEWSIGEPVKKPHFELIKKDFEDAGYEFPKLVFWNLRKSQCVGSPAKMDDDGVAMVSGFSPVLMKAILANENFDPMSIMFEALKDIKVNVSHAPDAINVEELSEIVMEYSW